MIQLSLQTHHVPPKIREMLKTYFDGFSMRLSTKEYTTSWIDLDVGIAMGCTISSILFVLAMEIILKAAALSTKENDTREILERLDKVVAVARMQFKPKKSRKLSLRKGKVVESVTFSVANQVISTVKSLGRWYEDGRRKVAEWLRRSSANVTPREDLSSIPFSGFALSPQFDWKIELSVKSFRWGR